MQLVRKTGMTSFLQTEDWMKFQKALGHETFEAAGAKVIKRCLPFGKNYLYIPYLPAETLVKAGGPEFLQQLKTLARRHKSIFIKVEPMQDEIAHQLVLLGFQKSSKSIQPRKTILMDLTKSEDELLSAMHYKMRYNIKLAERHGVIAQKIENPTSKIRMDAFWELMQKTSKRDRFSPHPRRYYEQLLNISAYAKTLNISLWFAYYRETPISAAVMLTHKTTAYYLHGASDYEYRAFKAPCALRWNVIKSLRTSDHQFLTYDMWGIDAQKWPGVTKFKLGWGGRVVEYPGAFDLIMSRPWYMAYMLAQKII